uniref:Uncharacterized protein n=1 Tax=Anguilla anguilla TaxID=7936 RepID=A0A0E9XE55_ANGAN
MWISSVCLMLQVAVFTFNQG